MDDKGCRKKHLTEAERAAIEAGLRANKSVYSIAKELGRPARTIMREIRARSQESDKGAPFRVSNRCVHRFDCRKKHICAYCLYDGNRSCRFCRQCNSHCGDYIEDKCKRLDAPPYVCNGCPNEQKCVLHKRFYVHGAAQENYRKKLVETRRGANISEDELLLFDETLHRLTANGQSVHAAMAAHPDIFMVNEKTVYRYIAGGLLHTKRGDLPRACSLKPRKSKSVEHKVDKTCRIGRGYEDYMAFLAANPGTPVTEMDTVEGVKGGKVLLTLMFMPYGFMAAFLLDTKTSAAVTASFAFIRERLAAMLGEDGAVEMFTRLFPVILTDNGTEFSNPLAIERDGQGDTLTRVFYCQAYSAWQKAHVERNHELARLILPKGTACIEATSFNSLTQRDVSLMLSHVNSYVRRSLKDKTPFDLFANAFGPDVAGRVFGITRIPPDEIVLKPSLLGIERRLKPRVA